MNYASIRTCDIANGEGVRVSLFVSGCTHRCKGCFNEEAQAFDYGQPFTRAVEDELLDALAPSHISGLTLLGGEPMEPANQRALVPFLRRFRERYGSTKTLWVYTGCVLEELTGRRAEAPSPDSSTLPPFHHSTIPPFHHSTLPPFHPSTIPPSHWRTEVTDEFLSYVDVLVDGPYVESLKDISLRFRGSSNQRIINLHEKSL